MPNGLQVRASTEDSGLPALMRSSIDGILRSRDHSGFIIVPAVTTGPAAQRRPQTVLIVDNSNPAAPVVHEALTSNGTSVSTALLAGGEGWDERANQATRTLTASGGMVTTESVGALLTNPAVVRSVYPGPRQGSGGILYPTAPLRSGNGAIGAADTAGRNALNAAIDQMGADRNSAVSVNTGSDGTLVGTTNADGNLVARFLITNENGRYHVTDLTAGPSPLPEADRTLLVGPNGRLIDNATNSSRREAMQRRTPDAVGGQQGLTTASLAETQNQFAALTAPTPIPGVSATGQELSAALLATEHGGTGNSMTDATVPSGVREV